MNPLDLFSRLIDWFCPPAESPPPEIEIVEAPTRPNTPHDGWHNQHFGD